MALSFPALRIDPDEFHDRVYTRPDITLAQEDADEGEVWHAVHSLEAAAVQFPGGIAVAGLVPGFADIFALQDLQNAVEYTSLCWFRSDRIASTMVFFDALYSLAYKRYHQNRRRPDPPPMHIMEVIQVARSFYMAFHLLATPELFLDKVFAEVTPGQFTSSLFTLAKEQLAVIQACHGISFNIDYNQDSDVLSDDETDDEEERDENVVPDAAANEVYLLDEEGYEDGLYREPLQQETLHLFREAALSVMIMEVVMRSLLRSRGAEPHVRMRELNRRRRLILYFFSFVTEFHQNYRMFVRQQCESGRALRVSNTAVRALCDQIRVWAINDNQVNDSFLFLVGGLINLAKDYNLDEEAIQEAIDAYLVTDGAQYAEYYNQNLREDVERLL